MTNDLKSATMTNLPPGIRPPWTPPQPSLVYDATKAPTGLLYDTSAAAAPGLILVRIDTTGAAPPGVPLIFNPQGGK